MQTSTDRLLAAKREAVLKLVATIIHDLTINARCYYDDPNGTPQIRASNEAIHRLAGHLRALTSFDEALTVSRAEAILATMALLPPSRIVHIESLCPL